MRSLLRSVLTVLTLGIATVIGCTGKKTSPPPSTDVTLLVPAMN